MIMNVKSLYDEFQQSSEGFYDDLKLADLDLKHQAIVLDSYNESNLINDLNFRNWSGQNDLGYVSQFRPKFGFKKGFLRPFYRKIFRSTEESYLEQAILDDMSLLEKKGYSHFLSENPVNDTPGGYYYSSHLGANVTIRWLRYIYLLGRINSFIVNKKNTIWLDVGSYYGGLQGLVKKYNNNINIILVDFHHQLARSYIYLKTLYPNACHILPNQITNNMSLEGDTIMYCPISKFQTLRDSRVSLFTNFFSFGEMSRESLDGYLSSDIFINSEKIYLANRFVSSPFFEPTYSNDTNILDYIKYNHTISYFDVFPMHHYQLIKRDILSGSGFRNVSSSYFELLMEKPY